MPSTMLCERCGAECLAMRRRKLCGACQAHRDLGKHRSGFSRECDTCGAEFWPFRTNHRTCWGCLAPLDDPKYPACSQCHRARRPAPGFEGTDRACTACVQASHANQRKYFAALTKRLKSMV